MRLNKLFIALSAIIALAVSCSPNPAEDPAPATISGDYIGTVTVTGGMMDRETRQTIGDLVQDSVGVSIIAEEAGTFAIRMYDVQFSNMMPTTITMEIPSVNITDGKISGEGIVPLYITEAGSQPYDRYTVTKLKGTITYSSTDEPQDIEFSLNFGQYPTSFKGKYNK